MSRRRRRAEPLDAETRAAAEAALGHHFTAPFWLDRALIHSSMSADSGDFERLEFLGDRVLGLRLAERLFDGAPDERESDLALRIAALARKETLADVARETGLGALLRDDAGDPGDGVLADMVEAVIAALHRDGGFAAAAAFIDRAWETRLTAGGPPPKDAKTQLQEWALARGKPLPVYRIIHEEGPSHARLFAAQVSIEAEIGPISAFGEGGAKRAAERAAAEALLKTLGAG